MLPRGYGNVRKRSQYQNLPFVGNVINEWLTTGILFSSLSLSFFSSFSHEQFLIDNGNVLSFIVLLDLIIVF